MKLTYYVQVNQRLDQLDVHVAEARKKKSSGRGNQYRPRIRGAPRADDKTKLPLPGKNGKRIPRDMINPDWLATAKGAEYDDRKFIADAGEIEGEDEESDDEERGRVDPDIDPRLYEAGGMGPGEGMSDESD